MYLQTCRILDHGPGTRLDSGWNFLSIEGIELASKLLLYEPKTLEIVTDRMLLVQYLVR